MLCVHYVLDAAFFKVCFLFTLSIMLLNKFRTLEERAQRLFMTKGKSIEQLDSSLLAKSKPGKAGKERLVISLLSTYITAIA